MKVLKFGGTSVGSIDNIKRVKELITDGEKKIVVLSAMSGTTNELVEISDLIKKDAIEAASQRVESLYAVYKEVIDALFKSYEMKQDVVNYSDKIFIFLKECFLARCNNSPAKSSFCANLNTFGARRPFAFI